MVSICAFFNIKGGVNISQISYPRTVGDKIILVPFGMIFPLLYSTSSFDMQMSFGII